ncbi:chalcone isomerase family protein [Flavobacterium branchiarum]|uniref:Chalcone isomerase family protein n=1 Tax=Flavobacterium branchiarum TaxID=1114870 RepID=A0ABV5FQ85_9FLAO|nr:chalcone isomerase family protein [Flavobacterium branchiarum]MDN3671807.1 chalcone isomerase family protein [Flavobacterium branchiarum]
MKNFLLSLTIIMTLQFSTVSAQKVFNVEGVMVPRTIEFQNKTLSLNGAGGRSIMWSDLYVQALYLSQLSQDAKFILESDTEMAIRIEVTSSMVSSKKLTKAMDDGFRKNAGDNLESLQPRIEMFKRYLSDNITKKDVFKLIYSPNDTSIWVYKNNNLKGKIEGKDFKKALFGIWLADKPADEKLKNQLLGK